MTNDPDKDPPRDEAQDKQEILSEFDRIQAQLSQGFAGDPRLASGVPQEQRGGDIEFIQMSGLVRPTSLPPAPPPDPNDPDLDASRPVSFFEKGVADVDADMVPGLVEDRATAQQEIEPVETARAAMAHLRDIIADLTKDAPLPDTDPALLASLEAAHEPEAIEEAPEIEETAEAEAPVEAAAESYTESADDSEPEPEAAPVAEEPAPPLTIEELMAEVAPVHPMQQVREETVVGHAVAPTRAEYVAPPAVEPPAPPVTREQAPAATPVQPTAADAPQAPASSRVAPVLPDHSARLAEAEKLLEELEPETPEQVTQFEKEEFTRPAFERPKGMDVSASAAAAAELPDGALDYKNHGKRRHRTVGKRNFARRLTRLAAGLIIATGLLAATYIGYVWLQQRMLSPEQLYNQAAQLVAKGEYGAASRLYEEYAALNPTSPLRADAQFSAAFTMQLQHPTDKDTAEEVNRQAMRLFETFCKDNPTHAKVARAETLLGRLNYEAGRYKEAIEKLRSPELRLRDPASAVPALRTLARAFSKLGDAESARSYYLQSVGAQDNHTPDVDYAELGSLYQSLADRASDLDKRIRLQQLAIESWTHALEVPGIDTANKQAIRTQLSVLQERLQSEPGMAPAMESLGLSDIPAPGEGEPLEPATTEPAAETPASTPAAPDANAVPAPSEPAAPENPTPPTAEPATPAAPTPALSEAIATPAAQAPEPVAAPVTPTPVAPAPPAAQASAAATPEPAAPADVPSDMYVVKRGDTLTAIAAAYKTTVKDLIEVNGLSGERVLEGQHLIVPAEGQ